MGFYQLKRKQEIQASLDDVWKFISMPTNLKKITPSYMGFDITSEVPEKIYPGLIISYIVKPLLGIKTTWVTEITYVKSHAFFVDEQRVGLYKLWHHEHHIESNEKGGVIMRDIVTYQPPFGILGILMNVLVIKKKLNQIFDYRFQAIENYFGKEK